MRDEKEGIIEGFVRGAQLKVGVGDLDPEQRGVLGCEGIGDGVVLVLETTAFAPEEQAPN